MSKPEATQQTHLDLDGTLVLKAINELRHYANGHNQPDDQQLANNAVLALARLVRRARAKANN